jgi:hypothetical protein
MDFYKKGQEEFLLGKRNRIIHMLVAFALLGLSIVGVIAVFISNPTLAHVRKHADTTPTPTVTVTPIANPSIEMLSATFSTQTLSNNKTVTLATIPLQLAGDAQVQVSAMLDLYLGDRGGMPVTSKGSLAKLSCTIELDETVLIKWQRDFHRLPVDRTVGLTTTAPASAGNHTLAVECNGTLSVGKRSNSVIQIGSEGISAVVATSGTSAATPTPTDTPTPIPTDTPTPTPTGTVTPTATPTGTVTPTATPTGTVTPTPTPTATATSTT